MPKDKGGHGSNPRTHTEGGPGGSFHRIPEKVTVAGGGKGYLNTDFYRNLRNEHLRDARGAAPGSYEREKSVGAARRANWGAVGSRKR